MRMIKIFCVVWIPVFFIGCQPPVLFGEPQPGDAISLSSIPPEYQGIYWCSVDSTTLYIDQSTFIKQRELLINLSREDIASNPDLELREGRLFVHEFDLSSPVEEKADTIVSKIVLSDTIFVLSKDQVLKPFKGHLVLNTRLDENAWAVLVATLSKGQTLALSRAEIPENIAQLDSITPVSTLSKNEDRQTRILITPTPDQFKKILDRGLLFNTSCSEFERIFPTEEYIY